MQTRAFSVPFLPFCRLLPQLDLSLTLDYYMTYSIVLPILICLFRLNLDQPGNLTIRRY